MDLKELPGHAELAHKELVSRALHIQSSRSRRTIVARNAATFPAGLIDAELFGNIKDYPNSGMRDRKGLIGEADGSTLFLDEIGELPGEMQAHLLRVLDGEGSYQRLGEDRPRQADIRLIAATNRDPAQYPDLGARLFKNEDSERGEPRIDPFLMDLLVRHRYSYHVRELESFLWRAMTGSRGRHLALTDELREAFGPSPRPETAPQPLTPQLIQACLDRHKGNRTKAYKELGLKNRHVLYRLIKKHGLEAPSIEGLDRDHWDAEN